MIAVGIGAVGPCAVPRNDVDIPCADLLIIRCVKLDFTCCVKHFKNNSSSVPIGTISSVRNYARVAPISLPSCPVRMTISAKRLSNVAVERNRHRLKSGRLNNA